MIWFWGIITYLFATGVVVLEGDIDHPMYRATGERLVPFFMTMFGFCASFAVLVGWLEATQ